MDFGVKWYGSKMESATYSWYYFLQIIVMLDPLTFFISKTRRPISLNYDKVYMK